ncbi:hypothetical protein NLI96_g344 [Meripilus lineatus]|uniref:lactoylglutathione lyase n=1 Tax=Meripilus lineatus TaxID=2056292 RepID=A0AAD5VCD6_9APHY|nr:hypothetical protein NLI96_g344 [Physisporinus lineatus]
MPRPPETANFRVGQVAFAEIEVFVAPGTKIDRNQEQKYSDFTLYFLAYDESDGSSTVEERNKARFRREGILELTHNHGTESDPGFQGYSSGNTEPGRGFGHIAVTVPDVEKACERFESLGVSFKKKLTDGKMRHIAFILDPDGYWVEILPNTHMRNLD